MRTTRSILLAVLIPLVPGVIAASAGANDGLRCPRTGRLVGLGARMDEVAARCGEPDAAWQRREMRAVTRGRVERRAGARAEVVAVTDLVEVVIDEWVYDFGPQRLTRELRFEQGRLVAVASGRYGTRR